MCKEENMIVTFYDYVIVNFIREIRMKQKLSYVLSIVLILFISYGSTISAKSIQDESFKFVCSEWAPYEYTLENGKLSGLSIEILRAVLKELKIKDNIKIYPWARAYMMVQKEKNVMAFTMARTKERENMFKWVGPIGPREIYLWKLKKRKDIVSKDWDDVKKYMIGTQRGSATQQQLVEKGFILDKNIEPVNTMQLNFKKFIAGRVDFICGLEAELAFGLKKEGFDPNKIERSLLLSGGLEYYYAFNKQTPDYVVEEFSKALEKIKQNGIFDKITSKYSAK